MSPRHPPSDEIADRRRRLKLLSFNIQAGTRTDHPAQWVTRGWQTVLPHASKTRNLQAIAGLLRHYDIVALQEADGGSLRSGFDNQTHQLAELAGFPYWAEQTNRRVARLAQPSNGLLSRIAPNEVIDHRLPGAIPGRGAMEMRYGPNREGLHIINAHLALTARARRRQFDYLAELIGDLRHVVVMGDLNTTIDSGEFDRLFARTNLRPPPLSPPTWPSWKPRRPIDHVLVSESLEPLALEVPLLRASDHLPIALTIALPDSCRLEEGEG
jgi:endonuclease/exonuclease/phosphatase family metal-dependent hydrolase